MLYTYNDIKLAWLYFNNIKRNIDAFVKRSSRYDR